MTTTRPPAAVGALVLIPIVIACGVTFAAVKLSEVGAAKWAQLQNWRRNWTEGKQGRKRKNSDPEEEGGSTGTWEECEEAEKGRAGWVGEVQSRTEN